MVVNQDIIWRSYTCPTKGQGSGSPSGCYVAAGSDIREGGGKHSKGEPFAFRLKELAWIMVNPKD